LVLVNGICKSLRMRSEPREPGSLRPSFASLSQVGSCQSLLESLFEDEHVLFPPVEGSLVANWLEQNTTLLGRTREREQARVLYPETGCQLFRGQSGRPRDFRLRRPACQIVEESLGRGDHLFCPLVHLPSLVLFDQKTVLVDQPAKIVLANAKARGHLGSARIQSFELPALGQSFQLLFQKLDRFGRPPETPAALLDLNRPGCPKEDIDAQTQLACQITRQHAASSPSITTHLLPARASGGRIREWTGETREADSSSARSRGASLPLPHVRASARQAPSPWNSRSPQCRLPAASGLAETQAEAG